MKLAMLSFEDVLESKMKSQANKNNISSPSGSFSDGGANKIQHKMSSSASRWVKAGAQVKVTNILGGKTRNWWEQDEYVSWHVRLRRKCGRCLLSCVRCQCFHGCSKYFFGGVGFWFVG